MSEKNITINLIYWGLHHLVWAIDRLGYDYMMEWRNQMCKWQVDLEKRYDWVGKNQRSWGCCPCDCDDSSNNGRSS